MFRLTTVTEQRVYHDPLAFRAAFQAEIRAYGDRIAAEIGEEAIEYAPFYTPVWSEARKVRIARSAEVALNDPSVDVGDVYDVLLVCDSAFWHNYSIQEVPGVRAL